MKNFSLALWIFTSQFIFSAAFGFGQSAPAADQIRQQALGNQPFLRASLDNLEIAFVESYSTVDTTARQRTLRKTHETIAAAKINAADGHILIRRTRSDLPDASGFELRNPRYHAIIDANGSGGFRISSVENEPLQVPFDLAISGAMPRDLMTAFTFHAFRVDDLFNEPFKFESSEWYDVKGLQCVKTHWTWYPEAVPAGIQLSVVFSPEEHWAIRELMTLHPQSDSRVTIEYQNGVDRIIPLRVVRQSFLPNSKTLVSQIVSKFEAPEPFDTPADEFHLSFYGLPEPKARLNLSRYLLIAVAVSGLGITLYSIRKLFLMR